MVARCHLSSSRLTRNPTSSASPAPARCRTGLVRRAQIFLACARGEANSSIARRMGLSNATVGKWRRRYRLQGIEGLHDELRPGRPRTHADARVAEVINTALQTRPPDGSTHWSVRTMAEHTGISKSTVHRWFSLFAVQPHRRRHFKLSNDPFFVEKLRDIVGLYLNPPDHAVFLCVDENTQIQALERTQPMLPMGLGYVEGVTHDYVRHGTTTLFAALDIATGRVMTQCKRRHRHQGFLTFLRHIDANVPEALDIHLIVDNDATHKHPRVRAWLARRPRYHVHYTPTYASWLRRLNWMLSGWANYYILGQVSPAYKAVDAHATRRLRRWLCRKHKVKTGEYVRFSNPRLWHDYGLAHLAATTKSLPWAKA